MLNSIEIEDIRNKLSPICNLITLLESDSMTITSENSDIFKIYKDNIEQVKISIDYLSQKNEYKIEESRGCCDECGEGYDNEEEWLYNTECELCGHPIPEHLIIKKP